MKFEKLGKLNPSKKYTINPQKHFENGFFKRLNFLLGFIEKETKDVLQKFIDQLKNIFEELVNKKGKKIEIPNYLKLIEKYPNVKNQEELAQLYIRYFAESIDLSNEEIFSTENLELPSKTYWQMGFGIRYFEALALTKVMIREEAIVLFKKYLNQYYVFLESTFKKFDSVEEFREFHLEDSRKSTDSEFVAIFSSVENGKFIIRNDNCPAVEALEDHEDKELIYLVCCYADFQYAIMTNENFRMTRFYTIAENDPYCDKVMHDIRISKELEHPSTELIDSMGPLPKQHWRKDYFRKK